VAPKRCPPGWKVSRELANAQLQASGIYEDGWTGKTGSLNLSQPTGERVLTICDNIPMIGDSNFDADINLSVDDKPVGHQSLKLGDFAISAPVDPQAGKRRVTMAFSATQRLPIGDGRDVGAHLGFIGFEGAESATASDIIRGAAVRLGSGWGAAETFKDQTFRWVDNDAKILITSEQVGDFALSLQVEPGPGVGGSLLLKALDSQERQVASAYVDRQTTVWSFIPVRAGNLNEFPLHVDGGGKPANGDPRILNFKNLPD
jgi:hypothetical protein